MDLEYLLVKWFYISVYIRGIWNWKREREREREREGRRKEEEEQGEGGEEWNVRDNVRNRKRQMTLHITITLIL